eukprot:scaffold277215_cov21-Prasinocladus_malaysianus.AAC.1
MESASLDRLVRMRAKMNRTSHHDSFCAAAEELENVDFSQLRSWSVSQPGSQYPSSESESQAINQPASPSIHQPRLWGFILAFYYLVSDNQVRQGTSICT